MTVHARSAWPPAPGATALHEEAASVIHALNRCYAALPTAGYANDSWAGVSIGWWGGEP